MHVVLNQTLERPLQVSTIVLLVLQCSVATLQHASYDGVHLERNVSFNKETEMEITFDLDDIVFSPKILSFSPHVYTRLYICFSYE